MKRGGWKEQTQPPWRNDFCAATFLSPSDSPPLPPIWSPCSNDGPTRRNSHKLHGPYVLQIQPPLPPASQPPPQARQPGLFWTAKRSRDEGDAAALGETEESAPKRQAKAQDVIFRIVLPSRQIGKVIGKSGHRIQKIREDTKATIKIADAIAS